MKKLKLLTIGIILTLLTSCIDSVGDLTLPPIIAPKGMGHLSQMGRFYVLPNKDFSFEVVVYNKPKTVTCLFNGVALELNQVNKSDYWEGVAESGVHLRGAPSSVNVTCEAINDMFTVTFPVGTVYVVENFKPVLKLLPTYISRHGAKIFEVCNYKDGGYIDLPLVDWKNSEYITGAKIVRFGGFINDPGLYINPYNGHVMGVVTKREWDEKDDTAFSSSLLSLLAVTLPAKVSGVSEQFKIYIRYGACHH